MKTVAGGIAEIQARTLLHSARVKKKVDDAVAGDSWGAKKSAKVKKGWQHREFPSGPPPQY